MYYATATGRSTNYSSSAHPHVEPVCGPPPGLDLEVSGPLPGLGEDVEVIAPPPGLRVDLNLAALVPPPEIPDVPPGRFLPSGLGSWRFQKAMSDGGLSTTHGSSSADSGSDSESEADPTPTSASKIRLRTNAPAFVPLSVRSISGVKQESSAGGPVAKARTTLHNKASPFKPRFNFMRTDEVERAWQQWQEAQTAWATAFAPDTASTSPHGDADAAEP